MENLDLLSKIGPFSVQHPIGNSAGTCKTLEDVRRMAISSSSVVKVGSITRLPRPGNEGTTYYRAPDGSYSLNSLGLNNGGEEFYEAVIPEMIAITDEFGKLLVFSVAGFSPEDYARLVQLCHHLGIKVIELNFGCPNLWIEGEQKPIFSFDPEAIAMTLQMITKEIGEDATILAKLSPYSDPQMLAKIAKVLSAYPIVKGIVASNTFPNGLAYTKDHKPAITPGGGRAGFAGAAIKAINLGQVHQFRELLPTHTTIEGVGGVRTGQDVLDYKLAGADTVGIATHYWEHDEKVFSQILQEYVSLLQD